MDIMELGAIGELVGGVAVIATLIYLALQVRENTTALSSTRHHEMLRYSQTVQLPFVENKDVRRICPNRRERT